MDFLTKKAYVENINAAKYYLSIAQSKKEGERWNCVSVAVYSAFCVEAYINHVGALIKGDEWVAWDKDNHPSPEEKLKRLGVQLSLEESGNLTELFQLRNIVSHGRTVTVSKNVRKPQNSIKGAMTSLSSEFEARTMLKKVEALYVSAREIVSSINESTENLGEVELWGLGGGSFRTS